MTNNMLQRKENLIENHEKLIKYIEQLEKICVDKEKMKLIKEQYYPQLTNNLLKLKKDIFSLAFIGMKSAGKSTLINALINKKDLLPEAAKATTATITKIRRRDFNGILVKFKNNKELKDDLNKIKKSIETIPYFKYNKENLTFLKELMEKKSFTELKEHIITNEDIIEKDAILKLLERFIIINDFIGNEILESKEDSLDSIKNYVVESLDGAQLNPNSLRVKEVIIYLNSLDLPEDIELVDLPGLGSEYKHHNEISLNYSETAHAFAVLGRGSFDDYDFANDFLTRVNSENLKKAFWIFTHSDSKTKNEIENEITEAKAYLVNKNIYIKDIYSTSAKKYFENMDQHVDDIDDLRENIFNYLNKDVKNEFYSNLENTLMIVKNHIIKLNDFVEYLETKEKIETPGFKEDFLNEEAKKRSTFLIKEYKDLVESTFSDISNELDNIDIWNESNKKDILNNLSFVIQKDETLKKIISYSRDYRKLTSNGELMDSQSSGIYENRIIEHIDNTVRFNNIIKERISSLLKKQVQHLLIKTLENKMYSLKELQQTKYISEVNDILDKFDVSQAITSTIDNSFDDYDEYVCFINDDIFKTIIDCIKHNKDIQTLKSLLKENLDYEITLKNNFKDKDLVNEGLNFYQKSMENYLKNLNYTINKSVKRTTENALSNVRTSLMKIIREEIDIYNEIKGKIDITEAFGLYQEKAKVLGVIYKCIKEVENENL